MYNKMDLKSMPQHNSARFSINIQNVKDNILQLYCSTSKLM